MSLLFSISLFFLMFAAQPMQAKDVWPLTIKVLSTKSLANEHGSFHIGWGGGAGGGGWAHRIAEHVFVEASNGNSYELVPNKDKDMLLPGTFSAKIEKRDMKVCEPKDNGKCREVKFVIVGAEPTTSKNKSVSNVPDPAPAVSPTAPTAIAQATLVIDSMPPSADIEIDGVFVGNTPSTVSVALGSHQIAVKQKGFTDWIKTLNVTGGVVHLNARLESPRDQPDQPK